jgi:hypothetical protein
VPIWTAATTLASCLSGQLPELSGNDAAHALEELLQKTRLALLVSGDLVLLTSQTSAALYSRQWTSPDWPEVGILAPGPLVDRLKEASRSEREERYLPARVWARLPSMPESPWDRGSSTGVKHLELPGWNAAQRELSLEEPVSMNYIHRPTFQIAGSVTFMVIVALGWWFLLRRFLVLMPLAAGFALAALAFSEPFAALASWAMLGIFFCIFLSFVIRKQVADKLEETRSANSTNKPSLPKRIENTVNPSKIRMSYKGENSAVKLLLIAATLSVASLSNAEVPKKDAVASPPSPVYRVFVPTDAAKKPVGDKVYVSEKFYNELYRRAASVSEKPRDWLLTSAVYRGMLVHESTSGQIALDALKAQFDLRTFNRAVRVRIPLRRENVIVPANSVLLDGRPLSVQWDSDGMAITFTVDEPGKYRLEFPLQPRIPIGSGGAGFEISIPRLPVARLELLLPSELPVVEVPSALGKVTQESEPPRVVADLGPTDRLLVNWREAGKGASVAEVEKLVWLKVQPGSVTFDVLLKGNALAGLTKLQLAADPRLRLQPLSGRELPTVQMQNSSDQPQIITLEWAQPLPEQATVALSFLMTGVSGVGNNGQTVGFDTLWGDGSGGAGSNLALWPAADYTPANRSHFDSRDYWFAGALQKMTTGWLGRWLDLYGSPDNPLQAVSLDSSISKQIRTVKAPVSAVTVVLPLVPVIVSTFCSGGSARAKSSMSPTRSSPSAAALRRNGSASDTPGETTTWSAPSSTAGSKPPSAVAASGTRRFRSASPGGFSRESVTTSRWPRAARCRAAETPVRPRPTITLRGLVLACCISGASAWPARAGPA